MQKYFITRQRPCNFHSASAQAEAWCNATPESNPEQFMQGKCCVIGNDVYVKWPKYVTGVINQRIEGGKWEKVNHHVIKYHYGGIEGWLARVAAVPVDFKGQPRIK